MTRKTKAESKVEKAKTTRTAAPSPANARMSSITVKVAHLPHGEELPLPSYQTDGAAGLDLMAAIDATQAWTLQPSERTAIPTGLTLQLPPGIEAQVRPRSGLAWKYGITVLNSPGTIDSDYRGEVQVILINLGSEPVTFRRGDRIAQLVIAPVTQAELVPVITLDETARGAGGFGSTGTAANSEKSKKSKKKKAVPAEAVSGERRSKPAKVGTSRRAS